MSVKVRQFKKNKRGGFEVDIIVQLPDGTKMRERRKTPCTSKSAAQRWGEERQAILLLKGKPRKREVPMLAQFGDRFVEEYAVANRQKPSTVSTKRIVLKKHLVPMLGRKRLDEIKNEDVQKVKAKLSHLKPKSVNCVLTVLSKLLKVAVDWGVIEIMPCTVRLLKSQSPTLPFYDFDDYERLIEGAAKVGPEALAAVLLGGDAGLRRGEIIALEWSDIDFRREMLTVARSSWHGNVDTPKSGRSRQIELTERLSKALKAIRHMRGDRVLYEDGKPVNDTVLHRWMQSAQRRTGLRVGGGGLHILRHSFCSHLSMQGAPARAIQELAGHADLTTTMRYMHLSPSSRRDAIKLLDRRPKSAPASGLEQPDKQLTHLAQTGSNRGDIVETGTPASPGPM